MALDTGNRSTDMTTFTIKVQGRDLPGTYRIVSVDISKAFDKISSALITLLDGDPSTQTFEASSQELLIPGKTIAIHGGYSSNEEQLFKGIITRQKIKMKKKGDSFLFVECKDVAFQMTLAGQSRYFKDLSDSELFEEMVGEYPDLKIETEITRHKHPEIVQFQTSDWDMMVSRAEKAGMHCLADDGVLKLFKPAFKQEPVMGLAYGKNILDLDIEMDARLQYSEVKAYSWDIGEQGLLAADTTDADSTSQGNISGAELAESGGNKILELRHSGRLTQQELDAWVEARMSKMRLARIRGTLKIQGTGKIKPGDLVELAGLGDRFNGIALVSGVRHSLGKGDWITSVQVGTQPGWHHEQHAVKPVPGSGFHIGASGLHIGVVTQLEGDPDGEERILVRLPVISPEQEGIWSRIATLDAGENRGTVFRPETDDEVIIGFIDDDPNQAVVLGMLHSSKKPSPIQASEGNHEKGWVSRSGVKMIFNDENPNLMIETPNGNKIVFCDRDGGIAINDENGNSITMDSDGITLDSAKKIILNARDNVSVEGMSIDVKAASCANIEGASGAALKSNGTTDVKGTLVKIN